MHSVSSVKGKSSKVFKRQEGLKGLSEGVSNQDFSYCVSQARLVDAHFVDKRDRTLTNSPRQLATSGSSANSSLVKAFSHLS